MSGQNVIVKIDGDIAAITLNRPGKLNAMNDSLVKELDEAFLEIELDIDVKVVLIKGAGSSFSVGEDLSGDDSNEVLVNPYTCKDAEDVAQRVRRINRRWEYIYNYNKVTIAQVQGYCLGAGLTLAMCCDLAIAAEDAVLGDPSARMGMLPAAPLWTWYVGLKKSKELLLLGRYLSGKEAADINLVTLAVPAARLEQEVLKHAQAICLAPRDAVVLSKEALNSALESMGVGEAWRFATTVQISNVMRLRGFGTGGSFDFFKWREQKGWRAAVKERDAPFRSFVGN